MKSNVAVAFAACLLTLASLSLRSQDSAERTALKKKLDTPVSFSFVDTTLQSAVDTVSKATGVPMTIDPEVLKIAPLINLKVADMKGSTAMDWILKLVELDYIVGDKVVYISTTDKIKTAKEKADVSPVK